MTAIIITAAVILLIFILLASSLTVNFEYDNGFKFKIKYLFFTIMMSPDSPRQIRKKKRKEAKKKKKEEKKRLKRENKELKQEKKESKKAVYQRPQTVKREDKPSSRPANEKEEPIKIQYANSKSKKKTDAKPKNKKSKVSLELIISVIRRASPHVKRIFKKIRVYGLYADVTVGGEDAAKVAVSYGVHCSIINGIMAFLSETVTFKAEKINIKADFDLEKTDYYVRGTVKLRLYTLLHSVIWGGFGVYSEIAKAGEKTAAADPKQANTKPPKKAA